MSEPMKDTSNSSIARANNARPLDSADHAAAKVNSKRLKATAEDPCVMTFAADHDRFARLQLLSTHTLHDLVSALCAHTPVGHEGSEGPDDHLWCISFGGKEYESSDVECMSPLRANRTKLDSLTLTEGCKLRLTYDYGTTSHYAMMFVGRRALAGAENPGTFPRNDAGRSTPPGYSRYEPMSIDGNEPLDLEAVFPHLQRWIFDCAGSVTVNLFQAGKTKNYGFMDNGSGGMLYLPAKPDDLGNYMKYFNDGARLKPKGVEKDGYAHYDWHSVVILPRSKLTPALRTKYCNGAEPGFCDAAVVPDMFRTAGRNDLNAYFPKIAALAGYRKDGKVPKGWATFTKRGSACNLVVCKGKSKAYKSNAPKGTAYDGRGQHGPVEEPIIEVSGVDVRGLNDLFCVLEGYLRTL